MSGRKRPAVLDPHEDDDSNVSSSAPDSSSPPDSDGRKRRRISGNSDTTPEYEHDAANRTQRNDDEASEEDSDHDTEGDEAAELQATQVMREKRARERSTTSAARECGILDNVELFDFMNHRHFLFELGPLINFVCGKNGSGKSAVLTAITICLGGKTTFTNRAKSMKELIRTGAEKARIICKIKNKGPEAYMVEDYGDVISVERYFSRGSSSGYIIKNASGRTISTKKGDLDHILDYYNLQMNNPLNVLSQDNAKQFLGDSKPADKYKFFIKGVQLEQLDEDYHLLEDRLKEIDRKLEFQKENVASLEVIKDDKIQKRELARQSDGVRNKLRELRRQIAWAQVREQENIIAGYDEQIIEMDQKVAEIQAEFDDCDAKHNQLVADHEATKTTMDSAKAELDSGLDEKRELTASYDEAKAEFVAAQGERTTIEKDLKEYNKTMLARQKDIEEEQRRLEEANGGGAARRLEELENAKIACDQARQAHDRHKSSKQELQQTARDKEAFAQQQKNEPASKQRVVDEIEKRIKELQSRDQQRGLFRKNSHVLDDLISRDRRWRDQPIGPIGKHVRLLRPEWSSILERFFGQTLAGYIVFSKHDLNIMSELKRRADCDAEQFIISKDFSPRLNEPDHRFDTILRVLEFDNDHVRNHLILQHFIEQQILVPDIEEATRLMYSNGGRLEFVKACLTFHPSDRQKGQMLKYTVDGHASQDPILAWGGRPRMKGDIEVIISQQQTALEKAQDELAVAKTAWQDARAEAVKANQALKRHTQQDLPLRSDVQAAEDKIEKLKDAIDADQVESGKLEALKDGLREAEEKKALAGEQYKDAVNEHDAKKREMRTRQDRMSDYNTVLEQLTQKHNDAKTHHQRSARDRERTWLARNAAEGRLGDARADRTTLDTTKADAEQYADNLKVQAEHHVGGRIELPEESAERLRQKYDKMREDHNRRQRQMGFTYEEAIEAAAEATKTHKSAHQDLRNNEATRQMLQSSLDDRRDRWKKFRQHITARARVNFVHLLSERGFRGGLNINNQQRKLWVSVEPDLTRKSGSGREANTLSGGEKSYSQICLLLSMWEAMGSPLRCLDEFDVFMDAVNRNTTVKMIVQAARDSVGKQYILISPGSKEDIPVAADVHVQELKPAERGQATLTNHVERTSA